MQTTRQEQDILKRQLTQNIAHELKTPVASIQGYLETILDNPNINDSMREQFLKRCYAQSQRLTSLLQDISTLNRMDDAPDMIGTEDVNISEIVANIQKETALQLQQKQMSFVNKLPNDVMVKGSPSLIYSVFRNLTDNAIASLISIFVFWKLPVGSSVWVYSLMFIVTGFFHPANRDPAIPAISKQAIVMPA